MRGMAHGKQQAFLPTSKTKVKIYQAKKLYRQWLVCTRIRIMAAPSKSGLNLHWRSRKWCHTWYGTWPTTGIWTKLRDKSENLPGNESLLSMVNICKDKNDGGTFKKRLKLTWENS
jgi:hypothetical protein